MKFETCGFEHLHLHTSIGSLLDGFGKCDEYCERAKKINQQFFTVTDHGMLAAVPQQIRECDNFGLTPIMGSELYVNPMQEPNPTRESLEEFQKHLDEDQIKKWRKSYHLLALAYNDVGYRNLVKLVSWGFSHGYGGYPRRPRVNHEVLQAYREGIIFSSCCYMGEIGQAFERGGEDLAFEMVEKYISLFSPNFILEAMMLDFKAQKPFDQFIIKAHLKYGIPLILSQDCHYSAPEDSKYQRYMLMVRTKRTIQDIEEAIKNDADTDQFFELQDQNLWLKSEEELNEKWLKDYQDVIPYELFCQAKRETVKIANKCKGVTLDRTIKLPQIEAADETFKRLLFDGFKKRGLAGKQYMVRLQEEYDLICRKGFSSYFIIQKQMIDEARRVCPQLLGIAGDHAVGPGRGSAAGSLACYCLGITDIDPIRHDLLFSRFISEARGGKQIKLKFSEKIVADIEGEKLVDVESDGKLAER